MTMLRGALAAVAFALVSAAAPAPAATFSPDQTSEIQKIMHSYLLEHPEILREAIIELDKREKAADADRQKKALADLSGPESPLYSSADSFVVGNPDGKITLVEFFDYNCGYCKKSIADIDHLMKDNKDLRVILRDLPILSASSMDAAIVAGAVHRQFQGDKFWDYHRTLLSERGVGKQQALDVAKSMGADMDKLATDAADPKIRGGIDQSLDLAKALSFDGTPSFVVADDALVGAVGFESLSKTIDNVRKCGKSACS